MEANQKENAAVQTAEPAGRSDARSGSGKAAAKKEDKKPSAKSASSVLEKAGKAAIARHGFKEVYVTSDGQAFPLRSDAQHHAADLTNKELIKVEKK